MNQAAAAGLLSGIATGIAAAWYGWDGNGIRGCTTVIVFGALGWLLGRLAGKSAPD